MQELNIKRTHSDEVYSKAIQFIDNELGSPHSLSQKIATYLDKNLAVDGAMERSDFDLFCFYILSHLNRTMTMAGLIIEKYENNADKV